MAFFLRWKSGDKWVFTNNGTIEALDPFYAWLGAKKNRRIRLAVTARLSGKDRRFLRTLLKANKRLNAAYLLKESFCQLWEYKREGWARNFFDNCE